MYNVITRGKSTLVHLPSKKVKKKKNHKKNKNITKKLKNHKNNYEKNHVKKYKKITKKIEKIKKSKKVLYPSVNNTKLEEMNTFRTVSEKSVKQDVHCFVSLSSTHRSSFFCRLSNSRESFFCHSSCLSLKKYNMIISSHK